MARTARRDWLPPIPSPGRPTGSRLASTTGSHRSRSARETGGRRRCAPARVGSRSAGRPAGDPARAVAIFPFFANEGNLFRYGLITLIYALLALGLNVVVGFAGLLDLGYVAFFGFGAYTYGIIASGHSGHPPPGGDRDPDRDRRRLRCSASCSASSRGGCSATTSRSSRCSSAQAFVDLRQQRERRPQRLVVSLRGQGRPDRGRERARPDRPAQLLRLRDHHDEAVLLLHADLAGAVDDHALLRQRLPDRKSVARAARGSAGCRDDEHSGQPVEAARVHVRRSHRGLQRSDLRRRPIRRVPGRLRRRPADHDLRHRHPRGTRQHRRCRGSVR